MSYNNLDESIDSGSVVELYEFIQDIQQFRFTSEDRDTQYQSKTYVPSPIIRDAVKQTSDALKDTLSIRFPRDNAFANQFLGFAPDVVTTLTIYRGHLSDLDNEFVAYWKGRIVGAKTSGNEITLDCESVFTSIKRPGLRAKYEYGCRHVLYQSGCNVNQESFKLTGAILSANSLVVEVAGAGNFPDGYFTGGIFVTATGVSRFITNHSTTFLTISRPIPSLDLTNNVNVYPGCDRSLETCRNKFNNVINFGGFPWIPSKNPFGGSSIV